MLSTFTGIGSQIGQFIERKQAEEAMELASLLPKENPYPVIRLLEGRILSYVNPAGRELLADWNLDLGDAAPLEIVEVAQATLSNGHKRDVEMSIGEERYLINLAPVPQANYVNLYFSNITDRMRTEEVLLQKSGMVASDDGAAAWASLTRDLTKQIASFGRRSWNGFLVWNRASFRRKRKTS